jgi:Spy/CpxP family protein refolding chaperone
MKLRYVVTAICLAASATAFGQGYGYGRGMMGGYGPGMMGGPGMMEGPGSGTMGPGMMWGYSRSAYAGIDLTAEQRKKIAEIEDQTSQAQWKLMGSMHQMGFQMHESFAPGAIDEGAARKAFDSMSATRKAMFDLMLDARKRMDAVLTKEQRDQLRRAR